MRISHCGGARRCGPPRRLREHRHGRERGRRRDTRTAGDQEVQLAYENGYQQCTGFSLKDLQQTYNAEELNKDSVGEAVARSNPGQPELHEPTKQGCIDAIDGKPLKQSGGFDPEGETNTDEAP